MHRYFIFYVILFVIPFGFGCSQSGSNADANSNPIVENPNVDSTDANSSLAEGKRLLDENQTEAAIAAFEKATQLNPDLAEAHFQLGIAYDLLEMQKEHSGEFVESTDDGKKKSRAEIAFERAVVAYKKWIAVHPNDDLAHFNLGRTFAKLNKDEEAVDSFERAVKLKPEDPEYQTELGAAQIRLARYHEAIKSLKKALELDETNVRAQELLEDAQAGRQRVDYKTDTNKKGANSVNKAANSRLGASNTNTGSNANTSVKTPASDTTPTKGPTPKPVSTPKAKEQPPGRMPNPETRPRKVN